MDFWQTKDIKIINNWVMVDFPDVLRQLGVDIFIGEGWERFESQKNLINEHSLDHNKIEDFIYRITEEIWENKKVENVRNYQKLSLNRCNCKITKYYNKRL